MSFTIQKSLLNSTFRFAVTRRRELRSIDANPELSTGQDGEFIRHRPEIFYSADLRTIHTPEVPPIRSLATTPLKATLIEETKRNRAMLAMVAAGGLFLFIGLLVLASKGAPGWFWIILGLVLAGLPLFKIINQRRIVRQADERKRREREERDARNRELLATYAGSLQKLRDNPNDEALDEVLRENEKLDLPYSIWADTAIGTVLHVGFSTLAKVGPEKAADVAQLMDRASESAGLIAEDALAVKLAIYSTILWHFLADDRLGEAQLIVVRAIQQGFNISDENVPIDAASEAQFHRLRGIDHRNAPRCEATVAMGLNEYCLYSAPIRIGDGTNASTIHITNKRVIVEGAGKPVEMAVPALDEIYVDADAHRISLRASSLKTPIVFTAGEPIFLAAMADLATRLDDRPKSFA